MIRIAGALLVSNLTSVILSSSDLWILGVFSTQEDVALYGAAARLKFFVVLSLMVVNSVIAPTIAEMYVKGEKGALESLIRTLTALAVIPSLGVFLIYVVFGDALLTAIYGGFYGKAQVVLMILSFGYLVNVYVGSCGQVLVMTGGHVHMMAITIISGVVAVVLCLVLVGPFGVVGVAIGASTGLVVQNLMAWIMAKARAGVWTHANMNELPLLYGALKTLLSDKSRG